MSVHRAGVTLSLLGRGFLCAGGQGWVGHGRLSEFTLMQLKTAYAEIMESGSASGGKSSAKTVCNAGLRGLHSLRHTWATIALRAGVHPKVVSERLGHSSVAITLDTYSHVVEGMDDAAAAMVAGDLRGGEGMKSFPFVNKRRRVRL